jgi:hypothetical protein
MSSRQSLIDAISVRITSKHDTIVDHLSQRTPHGAHQIFPICDLVSPYLLLQVVPIAATLATRDVI